MLTARRWGRERAVMILQASARVGIWNGEGRRGNGSFLARRGGTGVQRTSHVVCSASLVRTRAVGSRRVSFELLARASLRPFREL